MREDRDTHLRTRSRVVGDVITVHDQILGESRVVLIVFVVSSDAHATGRDHAELSSQCEAVHAESCRRHADEVDIDGEVTYLNYIACAF